MNWGTKLIIAMALFMAFIIALSTKMIFSDKDDLVEKDYYERGLNYDRDYLRKKNTEQDHAEPQIEQGPDSIRITFVQPATGVMKLAHASDRRRDKSFTINSDQSGNVFIPVRGIERGYWHLALEWKSGQKMYMFEKGIFIQ